MATKDKLPSFAEIWGSPNAPGPKLLADLFNKPIADLRKRKAAKKPAKRASNKEKRK